MTPLTHEAPIGQLVAERPSRARIFARYGIDYACGGRQSVEVACLRRGLDPDVLLLEIEVSDTRVTLEDLVDWSRVTPSQIIDNIVTVHHDYLRQKLPYLTGLFRKVMKAHGKCLPDLVEAGTVFEHLRARLERHIEDEEQALFPMIQQMEESRPGPEDQWPRPIEGLIERLEADHEASVRALERLRGLLHGYISPPTDCAAYRSLIDDLAMFELDLHLHLHKENNILFPRALRMGGDPLAPNHGRAPEGSC